MKSTFKNLFSVALLVPGLGTAKAFAAADPPPLDLTQDATLYVVAYTHLDTQYRWTFPQVIDEFLPRTLHDNFALIEKYPHYIFNFTGAHRYQLIKEYYPEDFQKLKQYVAAGRWFPCGSAMEECDVNSPAAESIFRQILYGNEFFRHEFGQAGVDFNLPDCFGFPGSLPSILAHAGLQGFVTQKLTAMRAAPLAGGPGSLENTPVGVPFNVGTWVGPDGGSVMAVLNPGSYASRIAANMGADPVWLQRIQLNGKVSGVRADYRYFGSGDIGGAPAVASVSALENLVAPASAGHTNAPGTLRVVSARADQIFKDIAAMKPDPAPGLPRYRGDLELVEHSAGSLTSEAYQKRWNRQNELLADASERASVAAAWLGGKPYPQDRLNRAWTLVMSGQFHDMIPGTAVPEAFEFAWNDDVIAMNQFADVLTDATESTAAALNTQTKGAAIVVYNPLNIEREDVASVDISVPAGAPRAVRVIGPDGREVPAQLTGTNTVLFLARVGPVGYAVFDLQFVAPAAAQSPLRVSESFLENARYHVQLDQNGDVAGIFDKSANKELLAAPARLALNRDFPRDWPAWNMDWADQTNAPRAYVQGTPHFRVVESGPVRVAVEVTREMEGSKFVQTIRLAGGEAGDRVEFFNVIDWRITNSNLKATFPLTASNPLATYNYDVGTVQRGNNDPKKYEVASHQWIDLTDKHGAYGVTVLTDCKNGSDKPDDNTLRLTLLRTPGVRTSHPDQGTQDFGHHEFVYGLAGHTGDWRQAQTDWQAQRLNQPLIAFESSKHAGALGRSFSLLRLGNSRLRVLALKKAEESDETIIRLVELNGELQPHVHIAFATPMAAVREVNGQEQPVGGASLTNGDLVADFRPYQVRTFAVKSGAPPAKVQPTRFSPVTLGYDIEVVSHNGEKSQSGFDGKGGNLPAEMLPREIAYDGISFRLAQTGPGKPSALVPRGQVVPLPSGKFQRLYILAASANGDQTVAFLLGDQARELTVQDWGGFIGQWDDRIWNVSRRSPNSRATESKTRMHDLAEYDGLRPGFIKPASVAWYASHHYTAEGLKQAYAYSYLFAYKLELPENARSITLPDNANIRILAATVAAENGNVHPAQPLYDQLPAVSQDVATRR